MLHVQTTEGVGWFIEWSAYWLQPPVYILILFYIGNNNGIISWEWSITTDTLTLHNTNKEITKKLLFVFSQVYLESLHELCPLQKNLFQNEITVHIIILVSS